MTATVPVPFPAPGAQARNFAGLAQLFGLFGWLTLVGGIVCPLLLYFLKRDEEPFVAFHALQTTVFQAMATAAFAVLVPILILTCVLSPLVLVAALVWLGFSLMGTVAAFRGEWARYPLVGGWALDHVIAHHAARAGKTAA
jgi:uncharacterized Tic20 family protein